MKRVLSVLLVLSLFVSLCACSTTEASSISSDNVKTISELEAENAALKAQLEAADVAGEDSSAVEQVHDQSNQIQAVPSENNIACEVVYSSVRIEKDSYGDISVYYVAQLENTGTTPIQFDYEGSIDLVDNNNSIVYTLAYLSILPGAINPGESAYISELVYSSFMGDSLNVEAIAGAVLHCYYSGYSAEVEYPSIDFSNISVTVEYGSPNVSATATNNGEEGYSDTFVVVPVFDANGTLVSSGIGMITILAGETKGFSQTTNNCGESFEATSLTATPIAYEVDCGFSFDVDSLIALTDTATVAIVDDSKDKTDIAIDKETIDNGLEKEPEEETLPETELPEADTTPTDIDNLSLDLCLDLLEYSLQDSWGSNYTLSVEEGLVIVGVWDDGISLGVIFAQAGMQEYIDSWNDIVDSMVELEATIQELLNSNGLEEYTVMLNVLNDMNTENILLSISFGMVTYDIVNGIDLMSTYR